MRSPIRNLTIPILLGGLAFLQLSCSRDITSPDKPSFAATATHLIISGPDQIMTVVRRTYAYQAYMGASYPTFYPWGVRYCPTLSITGCTVPWSTRYGSVHDTYYSDITESMKLDCTGGGTKSFQVRAQASAFAVPTETVYKVTRLCGDI
jgi:hypothetical protein